MTPPDSASISIAQFRTKVYAHYELHGRDLPWRHTTDPYRILIAEVMLQQTQVARVKDKYEAFIERFPNFASLSHAGTSDVLRMWQGLGYNRRAMHLHIIAKRVCEEYAGRLPQVKEQLLTLPGVGPYTAAAVRTFAFNEPEVFIETNIRAAYLHEFFPGVHNVRDRDILSLVEQTLDRLEPRRWYQALMDYGATLKDGINPSRRSAHHRLQGRFEGSRREARGAILRALLEDGPLTRPDLATRLGAWDTRFADALASLQRDGLVLERDSILLVAS